MAVAWNGTTLNDKVKLLSVTELGMDTGYNPPGEGASYTLYLDCKKEDWWLRSRVTDNSYNTWYMNARGDKGGIAYSTQRNLAPCIRLGKA